MTTDPFFQLRVSLPPPQVRHATETLGPVPTLRVLAAFPEVGHAACRSLSCLSWPARRALSLFWLSEGVCFRFVTSRHGIYPWGLSGQAGADVRLDLSLDAPHHRGLSTCVFVRGLTADYPAITPLALVLKQLLRLSPREEGL